MSAQEEWRPVPGFPGYSVSSLGRVLSTRRWRGSDGPRVLTARPNPSGYPCVSVCDVATGQAYRRQVHHLVAEAFLGSRPAGMQIRHLDGVPTNNALSNLRYGTASENAYDKVRHGTHHWARRDSCKSGHLFDSENSYIDALGRRICRPCRRDRYHRARQRAAFRLIGSPAVTR